MRGPVKASPRSIRQSDYTIVLKQTHALTVRNTKQTMVECVCLFCSFAVQWKLKMQYYKFTTITKHTCVSVLPHSVPDPSVS